MDVDAPGMEFPGGTLGFEDVTQVFVDAAAEMDPEEMVFMEGFSVYDAMSAFEIGEPRLDSGLITEEQQRPLFNPLNPLLPEEICWILDRAFAQEMEWHTGNFLQHTVLTLLYVHHLNDIDPDLVPFSSNDASRPIELITIVLRTAVQGLLKCCALTWRELSKGGVQDAEDWQSDKCDVSLLEGVPSKAIILQLDEVANWLAQTEKVSPPWKHALQARILLRKALLETMDTDVRREPDVIQSLVATARQHLRIVDAYPSPDFEPGTPAQLAFDPYISRRLNTFVPIRIIPFSSPAQTWKAIDDLLDGWQELTLLSRTYCLSTWVIVGNLRLWLADPPLRAPYMRSLIQSTFYDGVFIMNKFNLSWLIKQFFPESIGIEYEVITRAMKDHWRSSSPAPVMKLEQTIYKLMTPHIRALWYNPPRRRRHLMKSLVDWQVLYDVLREIVEGLDLEDLPRSNVIALLPKVALIWRLSCIREIVLSGFQLELYSPEEKAFAYWYAARVIDIELSCFDEFLVEIPKASEAFSEIQYQSQVLTALQAMSTALFIVTLPLMSFDWSRTRSNFYRRYKWAFRPEYDNIEAPVVGQPELATFMQATADVLMEDEKEILSPANSIALAHDVLTDLIESQNTGTWAGHWSSDRLKFLQSLISACKRLQDLPSSSGNMEPFNADVLKWDPQVHPWFPSLITRKEPTSTMKSQQELAT